MLRVLLLLSLAAAALLAQAPAKPVSPAQQEYLNEFEHAMGQAIALAKAFPAGKYAWRPGPGVRSVSEVFMHLAGGNLLLLGIAGVKQPGGLASADAGEIRALEKTETGKEQVLKWLARSADAVRKAYAASTPASQEQAADFFGRKTTVRAIYLRLLVHVNEHMGQAVAYARVNGIAPPWSRNP